MGLLYLSLSKNLNQYLQSMAQKILVSQDLIDIICNISIIFITVGIQLSLLYIKSKPGILCDIFPQHFVYHRLVFLEASFK